MNSHILSVSVSLCDTGNHVELATFLGSISSESMQHSGFNLIISSSLVTWSNSLADQILNTRKIFNSLFPNFLVSQWVRPLAATKQLRKAYTAHFHCCFEECLQFTDLHTRDEMCCNPPSLQSFQEVPFVYFGKTLNRESFQYGRVLISTQGSEKYSVFRMFLSLGDSYFAWSIRMLENFMLACKQWAPLCCCHMYLWHNKGNFS